MKIRHAAWASLVLTGLLIACSTSSGGGTCCEVGMGYGAVPSCICGTTTVADGGTCSIAAVVGETCTVSCGGMTAGGQTTSSCSEQ